MTPATLLALDAFTACVLASRENPLLRRAANDLDDSTRWLLLLLLVPVFIWASWYKWRTRPRRQRVSTPPDVPRLLGMPLYSYEGLRAIAFVWYLLLGVPLSILLLTTLVGGKQAITPLDRLPLVGWLIVGSIFALGPIAHWHAIKLKRKAMLDK